MKLLFNSLENETKDNIVLKFYDIIDKEKHNFFKMLSESKNIFVEWRYFFDGKNKAIGNYDFLDVFLQVLKEN